MHVFEDHFKFVLCLYDFLISISKCGMYDTGLPEITENILSRITRKQTVCICENKDADQLRVDREADQRLCFRYTDSTIPLLPKSEISSL